MVLTFDIFPTALNATIQTRTDVSHPPVLSMQMLSFLDAQMANKITDDLKGEKKEEIILARVQLNTQRVEQQISVSVCGSILS